MKVETHTTSFVTSYHFFYPHKWMGASVFHYPNGEKTINMTPVAFGTSLEDYELLNNCLAAAIEKAKSL